MRERFDHASLNLPVIHIHGGAFARWLTGVFRIGAITFGNHILVAPKLIERDGRGQPSVPGWLIAHEATHVWQYECAGIYRFLLSYLRSYFRALRAGKSWNSEARMSAYLSIKEECDARHSEQAYAEWSAREREPEPCPHRR